MRLTYCLLVTDPISGESGIVRLLRFADALVERGHRIASIFFYREGVRSVRYLSTAADENDLVLSWNRLVKRNGIRLFVCVRALKRRATSAGDLIPVSSPGAKEGPRFELGGMHRMMRTILDCDRCVNF